MRQNGACCVQARQHRLHLAAPLSSPLSLPAAPCRCRLRGPEPVLLDGLLQAAVMGTGEVVAVRSMAAPFPTFFGCYEQQMYVNPRHIHRPVLAAAMQVFVRGKRMCDGGVCSSAWMPLQLHAVGSTQAAGACIHAVMQPLQQRTHACAPRLRALCAGRVWRGRHGALLEPRHRQDLVLPVERRAHALWAALLRCIPQLCAARRSNAQRGALIPEQQHGARGGARARLWVAGAGRRQRAREAVPAAGPGGSAAATEMAWCGDGVCSSSMLLAALRCVLCCARYVQQACADRGPAACSVPHRAARCSRSHPLSLQVIPYQQRISLLLYKVREAMAALTAQQHALAVGYASSTVQDVAALHK